MSVHGVFVRHLHLRIAGICMVCSHLFVQLLGLHGCGSHESRASSVVCCACGHGVYFDNSIVQIYFMHGAFIVFLMFWRDCVVCINIRLFKCVISMVVKIFLDNMCFLVARCQRAILTIAWFALLCVVIRCCDVLRIFTCCAR